LQDRIKKARRGRGRPRQFDADVALDSATTLFWSKGLSATSLDQLAVAMNMKRPSLTNAFGDKESVYRLALQRFVAQLMDEVGAVLAAETRLPRALAAFFRKALDVYYAAEPSRGCFVMCTAPSEAVAHPRVRELLKGVIEELDNVLAARFERAKADGEFPVDADHKSAARMTQAVLHSIAIRARSGASRASVQALSRHAVAAIIGAPPS
jgi:AcrR family transcriptional regulator